MSARQGRCPFFRLWPLAALFLAPKAYGQTRWKLLYRETFERPVAVDSAPWVRDTLAPRSPWDAGPLSDGGTFFYVNGGGAFRKQLDSFTILRKRIAFGQDGWLTLELAGRGAPGASAPLRPPSFKTGRLGGRPVGLIEEPSHDSGVLLRSTKPLPSVYRIEYKLVQVDFGGTREGQWRYGGRANGYGLDGPRTSHPWPWGPGALFSLPYEKWPDVRDANGFYYLAIVDYPNPAPHNNVFIHTHRKVVIDSYNTPSAAFDVCDPATRSFYRGNDNAVDAFFAIPGTRLESKAVMKTECGAVYGGAGGRTPYVAAVQLMPETLPGQPYTFAIERGQDGYTIELSGVFRFVGRKTYRYHRRFVEDGTPIWHYNQTPREYDGAFDQRWVYEGPFGHLEVHSWPKGSAYPDYFIIGDPHLNYYEGRAAIADVRLYVPQGASTVAESRRRKR